VCVQLGNIISANIYRTADKPLYHKGNTHLIIINVLVIFLFLFTKAYYVTRNRLRDKKWNAMSVEVRYAFIMLSYRCHRIKNSANKTICRRGSIIEPPRRIKGTKGWISASLISRQWIYRRGFDYILKHSSLREELRFTLVPIREEKIAAISLIYLRQNAPLTLYTLQINIFILNYFII